MMEAAAKRLGGELRPSGVINVELGQGEMASVHRTPYDPVCGSQWVVFWPIGDPVRRHFVCPNLTAVEEVLADLCVTPRPIFQKGN